jgi:hypothetical protein
LHASPQKTSDRQRINRARILTRDGQMPTHLWCLLPILRGISAGKAIRNSHPSSRLTFQQLESAAFNNGSKSRQPGRKRNALLNRTWLAASP